MINSEAYIKNALESKKSSFTNLSIVPNISQKVTVNAASKICCDVDPAKVIAVIDTTVFSSGKEGCAFTGTDLYIKEMLEKPVKIPYEGLKGSKYEVFENKKDDGSVEKSYVLTFIYEDNEITFKSTTQVSHYAVIAEIMDGMNEEIDVIESNTQIARLEDMGNDITGLYLMIVTAYLKANDGVIDTNEYKELMSLMARIKVSKELADELRESRLAVDVKLDYEELIHKLDETLKTKNIEPLNIHQSLFFDLLGARNAKEEIWKEDKDLAKIKDLLGVTDEAATFGLRNLNQSRELIENRLTDSQFKESVKELGALAGGAGVALGALAITGGGSLASGLFTLGIASTGGMLLGLAAIGGVGYGAYKGIKYFSGTSELEKSGIRIEALRKALENNKATTVYIVEDINELNRRIQDILKDMKESQELDSELAELLDLTGFVENVSNSAIEISAENERNDYEIHIAKIPLDLPKGRYDELVKNDINKVEINKFVYEVYQKREIEVDNGEGVEPTIKTVYRRDEELDYSVAEKLYTIFESIGLYDTKTAAAASATAAVNKAKSFVKGLF